MITVQDYGNTSAASIPVALVDGLDSGRIKPTDTVLMVSFGAGLTWAASVVQMMPKTESLSERTVAEEPWAVPAMGD